jgi:recombination protein RecR
MKDQLPHLNEFIRLLQQVPYLASRNVYRVAQYFLEMPVERREKFVAALEATCRETVKCNSCYAWKEQNISCSWCHAHQRDQSIVCVVETWHDLCAIERTGNYRGVFHVLGGAICPLEGISPDDLSLSPLMKRVSQGTVRELILAMNQTLEGEATTACILRMLGPARGNISVTCLSRGVPVGSSLEAMDRLTVGKAIAERRPL